MIYLKISKETNKEDKKIVIANFYGNEDCVDELKYYINKFNKLNDSTELALMEGKNSLKTKNKNLLLDFLANYDFYPISENFFYNYDI